ncbi:MAG: ABC transporter substrate-binding protein/permease, partial [Spirochaetales bacterium]|nr:ABC transporter substrate-binding protein/permease [Spirochaetales bacterium]
SIPDLKGKIDAFLKKITEDGTLADMDRRWVQEKNDDMPEIAAPTNPTMHLVVGTSGVVPPYSYYKGSELVGYDIEMAYRLAEDLNASIEIKVYNYAGLLTAAQAGTIDCILANLNKTPERAEVILFSDPILQMSTGVMVRDGSGAVKGSNGFFSSIADSFDKTFVKEGRYKLFLSGIGMTLAISDMSIIFGTALGFVVYLLCRRGNRITNGITRLSIWLIQGMPLVVLLMVLFYIVFAKVPIDGMWVAIVCFTLTFGASMFGMLRSGVSAVDRSQTEAAYALGFKDSRTFFEVVLPQAVLHFLPEYKSQVVALIKATSIVGYIAISDLTKVADIVRSRTFDAFFPLFAIAVIYFVLAGLITFLIGRLLKRMDPHKRPRDHILKEVGK